MLRAVPTRDGNCQLQRHFTKIYFLVVYFSICVNISVLYDEPVQDREKDARAQYAFHYSKKVVPNLYLEAPSASRN